MNPRPQVELSDVVRAIREVRADAACTACRTSVPLKPTVMARTGCTTEQYWVALQLTLTDKQEAPTCSSR